MLRRVTASHEEVERAARSLAQGGVVAFPTETVYGLGADAEHAAAVSRIFTIKGRPPQRPLIIHIDRIDALEAFAREVPPAARRLAQVLWPGPITLVLPKAERVIDEVCAGGSTVGIRMPDHPIALELIAALSRHTGRVAGVAAPSANRFGEPPPTTVEEVRAALGDAPDHVLDGGPCLLQQPSTVVDCTGDAPRVLRQGAVTPARIAAVCGVVAGPNAAGA